MRHADRRSMTAVLSATTTTISPGSIMAKITYSMPAIAVDPDGYDAYDGKVTITQVSAITQELKIELAADAPAGASRLFATMGGMLGIIKNPSDPTAVVGEAMLKTWIGDITKNSSYERLEDDAEIGRASCREGW